MILANARARLTATDIDLIVQALAGGDERRRIALEHQLTEEGVDALLEHPDLLDRLVSATRLASPSAALFLYVLVRHTLRDVGIDDTHLSDYLAALLLEFGVRDRAHKIAAHDDQSFRYLTEIMIALDTASGRRAFLLRAHLGNYSLWLAGVFPDYIVARRERKGGPGFSYYDAMGAQGFRMARDHEMAAALALDRLYDRAAECFPRLRVALNRMSDRFLFPNRASADRLMRQVADEFNNLG
jgi:hypothetical protein